MDWLAARVRFLRASDHNQLERIMGRVSDTGSFMSECGLGHIDPVLVAAALASFSKQSFDPTTLRESHQLLESKQPIDSDPLLATVRSAALYHLAPPRPH